MLTTSGRWMEEIYSWMGEPTVIERKFRIGSIFKITGRAMKEELVFTNYPVSKQLSLFNEGGDERW
jgi:hypothetical protein